MNEPWTIDEGIISLTEYGIQKRLIEEQDRIYTINRYLEILGLDEFNAETKSEEATEEQKLYLPEILERVTDWAFKKGLLPNDGITQRDLFDTKLMGVLVSKPSEISEKFWGKYKESPHLATDWFYEFSQDTNYIRRDRIQRDKRWKVASKYGDIDITINLSKPEKDPKAIAAAKNMGGNSYPKCQLCLENEGYAGRVNHPARQNHRIIPIKVNGQPWGFQYSPYVYYNEHCIVFNGRHVPMKIDREAFEKLFSFVDQFPHYFLGSNADLPIVGGSILSHDHFQGGHYEFAMECAKIEERFSISGYEDVKAGIVHWPLSVIRLNGENKERVIELAEHILTSWRGYTDEAAFIYAYTEGEPHNTITPIARKHGAEYELDLVLRNNITTEERPLGVYHPRNEYHHIKKENIGLIEVMGLAVLPARLDAEMKLLEKCLTDQIPIDTYPELEKHAEWAADIQKHYSLITQENVNEILQDEIGKVFIKVLEDAGVYKCTAEGRKAFLRFIRTL